MSEGVGIGEHLSLASHPPPPTISKINFIGYERGLTVNVPKKRMNGFNYRTLIRSTTNFANAIELVNPGDSIPVRH